MTANVCRLSGKLAAEGCDHVLTVDDDGQVQPQSMVYTEYFARGTEPTSYCDLHPTRGFIGTVASIFIPGEKPVPVHVESTARPPVVVIAEASNAPPPAPKAEIEAPRKKRGFLSRIFHVGGDKTANDNKAREQ